MKQVIVTEHVDEAEVHLPGLYQRLIEICTTSAQQLLARQEQFIAVNCPACASPNQETAFEKCGYHYCHCQDCATLFISPRPASPLMQQYLFDSPVAAFRDSDEYQQATAPRAQELGLYRAEWVSELCERIRANRDWALVDVGTRSPDYLVAFAQRQNSPIIAVNPLTSLAEPLNDLGASVTTVNHLTELAGAQVKLITAFDVLEREVHLSDWMKDAYDVLGPGGLLVITTRSGSGFDIQTLWEQASIFPLEHINLVSVEGIRTLLDRTGFEIVEISTPGQLDVQMIERIWRERPGMDLARFLKYFLSHRDEYAKNRLQQFLQANLLSSYLRVVARKKQPLHSKYLRRGRDYEEI